MTTTAVYETVRQQDIAERAKPAYRVQYMNHQSGQWGPGDCWLFRTPNRRYTRVETALRIMQESAARSTAPAFRNGVTRVVEVDRDEQIVRVIDSINHDTTKP